MATEIQLPSILRMAKRGLKPVEVLAANRPHGDRLKYMGGCRCLPCRAANSSYEVARSAERRAGNWNGLVSAAKSRKHLMALSRNGIGRRSVSIAADVGQTCLGEIKSGRKKQIRKETERRILAVTKDAVGDATLVSAKRTWQLINRLIKEGFTEPELAARLGYKTARVQINTERVTARTAAKVERFYANCMAGVDTCQTDRPCVKQRRKPKC